MNTVRICLLAAWVIVYGAGVALAQTSSLTGRVVDSQGGAVTSADVTLVPMGSQRGRGTRSAADGTFTFADVAPGEYVLLVQAPGFMLSSQALSVAAAEAAPLTVMLDVAGIVEDVTVEGALTGTTATGKTNLPLRELPMTVHGVTNQTIREQGANDLATALQNVPGVNPFTNYGVYEYYAFRGFLDQDVQLVDGVRNEGNRINTQLAHIERVDVLKGPSSALYGSSALGATVNLIRKKPSAQPTYDFMAAAGSWQTARGEFGATGRLGSETFLYRLDIGAEDKDGYRHNSTTRLNVTPSLAWRIGASDQVNVYYTFNRDRFAGDAGIPLLNTDEGVPTAASIFPDVPRDRRFNTPQDRATSYDNNLQVAYARQLSDSLGFRNTVSYRHFNDQYFIMEYSFVQPPSTLYREYLYFKHHRRPLTNVAELTARVSRGLEQNLVFGWDSQRYTNRTFRTPGGGVADTTPIDLFNPVETQTQSNLRLARIDHFRHVTNAFYFQDHVTITPQLKALVGARYDIFRRRSHNDPVQNGEFLVGGGTTAGSEVITEGPVVRREAEALTGRIGLVYQPVPNLDLYGSFANSFRPLTQVPADGSTLEPERGNQYEFGQRFHMLGDRVQLNTTLFRLTRENVAFSRPGGLFEQAGRIRSRGFEAEVQTSPVSNWRINGGYSFTDVEFLDYMVSATRNLTGNRPKAAPRHTFNVWTAYDWANGFGVNVGVRTRGDVFADDTNLVTLDRFAVANVAVRYLRGPIEYALNVNNFTNTDYFSAALYDTQVYPGDPINVLATVRWRLR